MRKFNLLFLSSLMMAFTLTTSLPTLAQNQDSKRAAQEISKQQNLALRNGVYAAAKITGSVVYSGDSTECFAPLLPNLAQDSSLIVTGYVTNNICKLYSNGDGSDTLVTEYKVEVTEVIKGKQNLLGKTIEVNTRGGKIVFPDGVSAEETSAHRKMRNGNRYVLFLSETGKEKKLLFPFGMTSGVFEITNEQKIIFCGGAMLSPAQLAEPNLTRQTGRALEEFLQEVRSLVTVAGN